jgi:hypothetical protein
MIARFLMMIRYQLYQYLQGDFPSHFILQLSFYYEQ